MNNKRIIIDDFQVFKFRVIRVESIPDIILDKVKINEKVYSLVPTSDIENCIAFEYDCGDTFLNCEVEFL